MSDLLLSLGFFFSALMQGMTGFGSAIGMNAFLTKIADIKIVSPAVMALTLTLNLTMLSKNHQLSHFPHLKQLVGRSLVGIPIGYWMLGVVPHKTAVYIIAGLIGALFCFQIWTHYRRIQLKGRLLDVICLLAGIFGFAYNVTGLFIALYVLSIDLPKDRSLRLTATYFLIINIIGVLVFLRKGWFNQQVIGLIVTGFPMMVFGGLTGLRLSQFLDQKHYTRMVRGFLIVSLLLMLS